MNILLAFLTNFLRTLTISRRFIVLMTGLIVLTALFSMLFYSRQQRSDQETRLQEKAAFINKFYSFLIADALMRQDDITLLQVVNGLEQDPEISAVIVVDQRNEIRYHADPHKVGSIWEDAAVKNALQSGDANETIFTNSGGKALALTSPLKVQGIPKPIGAIRIDFTYRQIDNRINSSRKRFLFVIFGSIVSCVGLVLSSVNRWLLIPFQNVCHALAAINPVTPEPNLPEPNDELGKVFAAINDLVSRFKTEWQQQWSTQQTRGEQEKTWIRQLLSSFLPNARIIVVDKDNRVISDSGNTAPTPTLQHHLLDLIQDANFATLLNEAFKKEGEVVLGSVTFQKKNYQASILSVPLHQAIVVKTLIALQPH